MVLVNGVPLGDQMVNAQNASRIGGVIVTGLAATMIKRLPQKTKRGLEIAHYAYVPLAMRSVVNLARQHLLSPVKPPFQGMSQGGFQGVRQEQAGFPPVPGGGYRPFAGGIRRF